MYNTVIGILAHVDAGKTTLAEALLYTSGGLRKAGRVDHGDALLDSHALEKARGITIFAGEAPFTVGGRPFTLLDTPGHVDFSAETERTLQVLDYAILVISASDGVQAHTRTLWRLLELYRIPTLFFITKMDLARQSREQLLHTLREELSPACTDFSPDTERERMEGLALCREELLEGYLTAGTVSDDDVTELIRDRLVFPCFFGSGLKLEGIGPFLQGLCRYTHPGQYPDGFAARVFKISRDAQGKRLTHLKVTGGTLRVRDAIGEEKASQLRIYSGAKFTAVEEVAAGGICAVTGLELPQSGQGLGGESAALPPLLEPVMNYRILLPEGCDARVMLPKLRLLEEEDPQLHITWDTRLQEIHVGLMGEVQAEILKSLIEERYGVTVTVDHGRVQYRETITNRAEGIGHYEPLRHYAEVHLLLEPLPRGSGLRFLSLVPEDTLDHSWQQLILTHLAERQHAGVLTGAPITDLQITVAAGRAHQKHTEGGDFREATYRAVRQGLMQAESILLEPYCRFRLEVPPEQIGRAITDIRARCGTHSDPEASGSRTLLRGRAPVITMNDYAAEVAAYTHGEGRLQCEPAGYDLCHNAEEVIAAAGYDAAADRENPADSVFCIHGSGHSIPWREVPAYMHLPSCLKREMPVSAPRRSLRVDDEELRAIIRRAMGEEKRPLYRIPAAHPAPEQTYSAAAAPVKSLIVDGYNVIYAWEELAALAAADLDAARGQLLHILSNYAAYTHCDTTVIFDAYRVAGGSGKQFDFHGLHVVYTRENETADLYIEKMASRIGKNEQVRVVTSDGLIQLSALRAGVLRMSAREFGSEVDRIAHEIGTVLQSLDGGRFGTLAEALLRGEEADEQKRT